MSERRPVRLQQREAFGVAGPDSLPFPLRANNSDAAIITVTVVDAAGVWCPHTDHTIRFTVTGRGLALGSVSFESVY